MMQKRRRSDQNDLKINPSSNNNITGSNNASSGGGAVVGSPGKDKPLFQFNTNNTNTSSSSSSNPLLFSSSKNLNRKSSMLLMIRRNPQRILLGITIGLAMILMIFITLSLKSSFYNNNNNNYNNKRRIRGDDRPLPHGASSSDYHHLVSSSGKKKKQPVVASSVIKQSSNILRRSNAAARIKGGNDSINNNNNNVSPKDTFDPIHVVLPPPEEEATGGGVEDGGADATDDDADDDNDDDNDDDDEHHQSMTDHLLAPPIDGGGSNPFGTTTTETYSFVEGEKKLKKELTQLMERQTKLGEHLGAKVATRWLGDHFQGKHWLAIDGNNDDEEVKEWDQLVKDRMNEMRKDDETFWANRQAKKLQVQTEEEEEDDDNDNDDDNEEEVVDSNENDATDSTNEHHDDHDGIEAQHEPNDDNNEEDSKEDNDNNVDHKKTTKSSSSSSSVETKKLIYPSPSDQAGTKAIVMFEPTFGKHRSDHDAVFAFAEGYDLRIYVAFVESLKATGFHGDIVLSVSHLDKLKSGVEEYLRAQPNIVVYTVDWTCFNDQGIKKDGPEEGRMKCQMNGFYGLPDDTDAADAADADADEIEFKPVDDPRLPRPVATARYELYWAWSLQYDSNVWIMLIDSRDTWFQTDPFSDLPRKGQNLSEGTLRFFAENASKTKVGGSKFNSKWLLTAYGKDKVQPFFNQQIICSGSSMGEQIAIESYLRAMVAQFDETRCMLKGCDQGFHNYLYYTGILSLLENVNDVIVYDQGFGIINNLGLLRDEPLETRGILDKNGYVLNMDGKISPVAHQYDRDRKLTSIVNDRKTKLILAWKQQKQQQQQQQ